MPPDLKRLGTQVEDSAGLRLGAMDDLGTFGFREPTPHAVGFLDAERVLATLLKHGALGTNAFGVFFAALAFAATLGFGRKEDGCVFAHA